MNARHGVYNSRYLSFSALAELIGVSTPTARRWLREGQLPPPLLGLGIRRRWSREAVVRWAEEKGVPLND